jgi:hypothetical protein
VSYSFGASAVYDVMNITQDGGHLLIRLTHLPPTAPADLAPPPSAAAVVTNFGATEGSGRGTSSGSTASAAAAEAAVAVVAGSSAAAAVAAAEGGGRDGGFPGAVGHYVKSAVQEAEQQVWLEVITAVQQAMLYYI